MIEDVTNNGGSVFFAIIGFYIVSMCCRDDRIVDFYYPILSCFLNLISDPNPVLVKIILDTIRI